MRIAASQYPEPANPVPVAPSPVLSLDRDTALDHEALHLHAGEMMTIAFAPGCFPLPWTEPTSFAVGPLLAEIMAHLDRAARDDPTRPAAETLLFQLLTPLPAQRLEATMPRDPRVRTIAERLIAHPDDPRELAAWADHVHAGVRTLSRLFRAETGRTFAGWRTQVRVRAAVQLLADGTSVHATARAVGYRRSSAFIAVFRRVTGQTPGSLAAGSRSGTPPRA
ncbi:MAG TPA: AraC family transcriptional regulator [Cellulomonas sp.]